MNQKRIFIITFLVFINLSVSNSCKPFIPRIDREISHRFNIAKSYYKEQEITNTNYEFNNFFLITFFLIYFNLISL